MKKVLITLIASVAALCGNAGNLIPAIPEGGLTDGIANNQLLKMQLDTRPATRADGGYWFGYCAGLNNFLGIPEQYYGEYVIEGAILVPAEFSSNWKGNTISKLNIGFGKTSTMTVQVYITEGLDQVPVILQEVVLQNEKDWNEITLNTPYTISGKEFYVGYQAVAMAGEEVLGIDRIPTSLNLGDFYGVNDTYENLGQTNGSLAIRFEMDGEIQPAADALVDRLFPPSLIGIDSPKPFETDFTILNLGAQTITGMELTATLGGEEIKDLQVTVSSGNSNEIPFGTLGMVAITGFPSEDVIGNNVEIRVNITGLQLADGTVFPFTQTLRDYTTVSATTFVRNFVIEEFTGTWCGWCPRGKVGMEKMAEKYGNEYFIGIAAHNKDEMALANYQQAILQFGQDDYPDGAVNRQVFPVPVKFTDIEYYYNLYAGTPTTMGVDVEARYIEEENVVKATATAQFANDNYRAKYAFAFVLTQDHVGPYRQTNYFNSGTTEEGMEGWVGIGSKPEVYFDDVARVIKDPYGIPNSIPNEVMAFEDYTYTVDLPLDGIEGLDINNCHVVALLLNTSSEVIENAAKFSLEGQAGIAGIEDIISDPSDGVYRVYNLQGVKVLETRDASQMQTLARGIYIVNGKKVAL